MTVLLILILLTLGVGVLCLIAGIDYVIEVLESIEEKL